MSNENLHEHSHEHGHTHDHEHQHHHEHNHMHDGHEHSHEHDHNHVHPHNHSHSHEHNHDGSHGHCHCSDKEMDNISKEERTLRLLLNHWVEHNKSHEEGFSEWVEKSRVMGKADTADFIQKAIDLMKKADEMLLEAQKHM
ncbi:zinc transporter [Clostridium sp. CX1]|uniref:Zinc transporter n=1 Tax=Clostridium tanneri TaxID=3037988 RepID=A0ABU4JPD7_9CLOT|nr:MULTISPECIES: zinc transporter [unclassified Clostridium]MCT8976350.1 zinc transporter [Clostridium sp. CX1]MDW8800014.1 zinc transporter [Clostridium sp. A1-XYC3]